MKGWAISLLHLSLDDFGRLRVPEFWAAMEAYSDEKNADRRHMAELVRGATMKLWNLQVDEKHRCDDPRKFWRMPYDKDIQESKEVKDLNNCTDEERSQMAREFLNRIRK